MRTPIQINDIPEALKAGEKVFAVGNGLEFGIEPRPWKGGVGVSGAHGFFECVYLQGFGFTFEKEVEEPLKIGWWDTWGCDCSAVHGARIDRCSRCGTLRPPLPESIQQPDEVIPEGRIQASRFDTNPFIPDPPTEEESVTQFMDKFGEEPESGHDKRERWIHRLEGWRAAIKWMMNR